MRFGRSNSFTLEAVMGEDQVRVRVAPSDSWSDAHCERRRGLACAEREGREQAHLVRVGTAAVLLVPADDSVDGF